MAKNYELPFSPLPRALNRSTLLTPHSLLPLYSGDVAHSLPLSLLKLISIFYWNSILIAVSGTT